MAQELCSRTASGNILKKPHPKETVHVISCDPPFKGRHARYKTNGTSFKLLSEKNDGFILFLFFCEKIIFNRGFSIKSTCGFLTTKQGRK